MAQPRTHVAGTHILIIDDDPAQRTVVGMILDRVGIQTTGVETATEGGQLLNTGDFKLLILDLMLPDMDGLDFLRTLRQDDRFDSLPVLVLSARVEPEAVRKALALGADSYLTKPYLRHSLVDRVTALLAQERKRSLPPHFSPM
jgi:DNA-binding response OmpR family regulator